MTSANNKHEATDSAVGYYFQGLFALVTLLREQDDSASVSVETADDVVLSGSKVTLHQLKHSLGTPPALTESSDGWWKTIAIWTNCADDASVSLRLVTCAALGGSCALRFLQDSEDRDVGAALAALEVEAARVLKERADATAHGEPKLPYAARAAGCASFMSLSQEKRAALLERVVLCPDSFNANAADAQIDAVLSAAAVSEIRPRVRERLIEWWEREIALSLLGRRGRQLDKRELQRRVSELLRDLGSEVTLPDDFGDAEPPSEKGGPAVRPFFELQIEWVEGGSRRITRARTAWWRAREQRERWLREDLASAAEMKRYDARLIEAWQDRFGPMVEDLPDDADGKHKCRVGRELLDWSHDGAPTAIEPIRPQWDRRFFVRGTFQQLADENQLGWHPEFESLAKVKK